VSTEIHLRGLLDALPPGWDAQRDLAVLVGAGLDEVGRALVEGGWQRVIAFRPGELPPQGAGPRPTTVRTRGELLQAVLHFRGALPRHVTLRKSEDPWASAERMTALGEALRECLHAKRLLHHTVASTGRTNLEQGLGNLAALARVPTIAGLDGAFAGTPAVIVSPGPSLSRNLALLPDLKGRALLLTGTHALRSFERVGTAPDLVLAADPGDLARHCDGFDLGAIEAYVAAATCRPDSFERAAPRTLAFAGNAELDDWLFEALGENARLPTGGSVACSALSLALRLGCAPILLVGQDLSFEGGRYYAEENQDGEAEVALDRSGRFFLKKPPGVSKRVLEELEDGATRFTKSRELVHVPGYHGGTVPSSESFRAFLFWFETVIDGLDDPQRVWNCTEGGARIAGARQLPLAQALGELPEPAEALEVGRVLDAATAGHDAGARRARLRAHFGRVLSEVRRSARLADRCRRALARIGHDEGAPGRLAKLEERLRTTTAPLAALNLAAQQGIETALAGVPAAPDDAARLRLADALHASVEEAARFLEEPLLAALADLDAAGRAAPPSAGAA
jgi:hypothetical protein